MLSPTCSADCHVSENKGGFTIGDEDGTYAALVDRASTQCKGLVRVKPNDPEGSALVAKTHGNFGTKCKGYPMPPKGPKLSSEKLDLVQRWIAGGAKR